jgi:phosphonate metabolism-associated iron-containing alcohol dehydrogenase
MQNKLKWAHFNPVKIVYESLDSIGDFVCGSSILVVTSSGSTSRGISSRIVRALPEKLVEVWDEVQPNPAVSQFPQMMSQIKSKFPTIDTVIGVGGGSSLDVAKVLAHLFANADPLSILENIRTGNPLNENIKRLELILIPTTSGTGSEVTPFATLWDHEVHQKYSFSGNTVFADYAVLDPSLTLSLSEVDTLYPALDAISHSLESLWNNNITPISKMFALEALSKISNSLPQVMTNPKNLDARADIQIASTLAGIAISRTKTAIAHSISYPFTARFGVPHGLAASFTLPYLINRNINRMKLNEDQKFLIDRVSELLKRLCLPLHMQNYIPDRSVLNELSNLYGGDRAKNYIGIKDHLDLDEIVRKSLEV